MEWLGWFLFRLTMLVLFSVVAFVGGIAVGVRYSSFVEPFVAGKDTAWSFGKSVISWWKNREKKTARAGL